MLDLLIDSQDQRSVPEFSQSEAKLTASHPPRGLGPKPAPSIGAEFPLPLFTPAPVTQALRIDVGARGRRVV